MSNTVNIFEVYTNQHRHRKIKLREHSSPTPRYNFGSMTFLSPLYFPFFSIWAVYHFKPKTCSFCFSCWAEYYHKPKTISFSFLFLFWAELSSPMTIVDLPIIQRAQLVCYIYVTLLFLCPLLTTRPPQFMETTRHKHTNTFGQHFFSLDSPITRHK